MITSKLTTKAQTTIPQSVRTALRLQPGDELAYKIENGHVVLTRKRNADDNPFATFSEWAGDADTQAYGGL